MNSIKISDELYSKLQKKAYQQNISIEKLLNELIVEDIDYDFNVIEATKNICLNGITIETLKQFGNAYADWFYNGGVSGTTCSELFQKGFDKVDFPIEKSIT